MYEKKVVVETEIKIGENCQSHMYKSRGRFSVGVRPHSQGLDPFPTQRVPLCTILRYSILVMDSKIFLQAQKFW